MAQAIMAGEREDPARADTRRPSAPAEGRDLKTAKPRRGKGHGAQSHATRAARSRLGLQ
jgi:hypothetical protein